MDLWAIIVTFLLSGLGAWIGSKIVIYLKARKKSNQLTNANDANNKLPSWLLAITIGTATINYHHPTAAQSHNFQGRITKSSVEHAIETMNKENPRLLQITSEGGEIDAAIILAEYVLARGLGVVVQGQCNSACANYVFLAGKTKIINANSLIVWHGGANDIGTTLGLRRLKEIRRQLHAGENINQSDSEFFAKYGDFIDAVERRIARQHAFYKSVGIDELLTRFGHKVPNNSAGWTSTIEAMRHFGLHVDSAPPGFGEPEFVLELSKRISVEKTVDTITLTPNGKPILVRLGEKK